MDPLAAHMQRVYQVYYFPNDYRAYLTTQKQPYMDVRHIVRTRLGALHEAGPSAVARAEVRLREGFGDQGGGPTHATIIHSRQVTEEVLAVYQPLLVKRMARLIGSTMD